jgi:hypothetical protein
MDRTVHECCVMDKTVSVKRVLLLSNYMQRGMNLISRYKLNPQWCVCMHIHVNKKFWEN